MLKHPLSRDVAIALALKLAALAAIYGALFAGPPRIDVGAHIAPPAARR